MPPAAVQRPRIAACPAPYPASLYAPAVELLAFELLPLGILLWTNAVSSASLPTAALPVNAMMMLAFVVTVAAVVLGLLAADAPARPGVWPGLIALLLLPPVIGAVLLLPSGQSHIPLWLVVFLGIVNGQMAAAACLRQAAASIPASRFRAAALDCIRPGQRLRHVVLPACAPALVLLAALTFVGSWSAFLLAAALRQSVGLAIFGAQPPSAVFGLTEALQPRMIHPASAMGLAPGDYLTMTYLLASVPMVFLGLWAIRACLLAAPRPFARARAVR